MSAFGLLLLLSISSVVRSSGSQSCSQINSSTSVEIASRWRATVQITLNAYSECGQLPDLPYTVQLFEGDSYSSCERWTVRDASMHWSTTTTCDLPSDRVYNWTLVAESAESGEIVYENWHQFYTTDVQRVMVTSGTTDLHITCHFAPGSTCEGCFIRIELVGLNVPPEVVDEVEANRLMGSLESSAVVQNLLSNHHYHVTAYDIQQSGNVSDIGVPLHGLSIKTGDHHGNQQEIEVQTIIIPVVFAALVAVVCISGVLTSIAYRDKVKVTVKMITHRRQARHTHTHDARKKSQPDGCAPDFTKATPPQIPPRSPNTRRTQSTESTAIPGKSIADLDHKGIPNPLSPDSGVFVTSVNSSLTTTVEIHHQLTSDLEDTASDSEAPPIPGRLEELPEVSFPPVPPRSLAYYDCAAVTSFPESSQSSDPPPFPPKPGVHDRISLPPTLKNTVPSSLDGFCRAMPLTSVSPSVPFAPMSAPVGQQDDLQEQQELSESDFLPVPEGLLPPRNIVRHNLSPRSSQADDSIMTLPNPAYQTHCLEVGRKSLH